MRVERLLDRPIISADLHPSIGANIQGPSLIRVPDWIAGRLGDYYLYFADRKGRYIRLAYADNLLGPMASGTQGCRTVGFGHRGDVGLEGLAAKPHDRHTHVADGDMKALSKARWPRPCRARP